MKTSAMPFANIFGWRGWLRLVNLKEKSLKNRIKRTKIIYQKETVIRSGGSSMRR